jgi:hypothetical protein
VSVIIIVITIIITTHRQGRLKGCWCKNLVPQQASYPFLA